LLSLKRLRFEPVRRVKNQNGRKRVPSHLSGVSLERKQRRKER
jgi:hypothetical protein